MSPWKRFLAFRKMELSGSNVNKFLIFSYILGNGNPENISLYFRERKPWKTSYNLENGTFKPKLEKNLKNPPQEDFLYSGKMEPSHLPSNSLYFRKQNFLIFPETKLSHFKFITYHLSEISKYDTNLQRIGIPYAAVVTVLVY